MINVRVKGQCGEREIADDMNSIVDAVRKELQLPALDKPQVQRNQNQSAVGGCDLTGTFGLAVEVKRQETLSINTWWAQCVKSAEEREEIPVLLFRQNAKPGQRTKWRCITIVEVLGASSYEDAMNVRAELEYEEFQKWFRARVVTMLKAENPQVQDDATIIPVRTRSAATLFDDAC